CGARLYSRTRLENFSLLARNDQLAMRQKDVAVGIEQYRGREWAGWVPFGHSVSDINPQLARRGGQGGGGGAGERFRRRIGQAQRPKQVYKRRQNEYVRRGVVLGGDFHRGNGGAQVGRARLWVNGDLDCGETRGLKTRLFGAGIFSSASCAHVAASRRAAD